MNSFSTSTALLLPLLILLCLTGCKRNTETISDGTVSNGVLITLDIDGGSKVIVNPNASIVSITDQTGEYPVISYANSNVSTKITEAGGSGLNWAVYWSTTESSDSNVWCLSFNNNNGCHAHNHTKEEASDTYCRAFFAF